MSAGAAHRLQPLGDDDRGGSARAGRPAGLLRRRRPAQHRGQPGAPDRGAGARARLRGRRLRGASRRACRCRIGDPTIVTGATAVVSMLELFGYYLQGGLIDVGFLGAAQIDRFGNINTTVIGDYAAPKTRLPGSGGACEIAINAREVFVIMRQSPRSFVERIDFRTSPGNWAARRPSARSRSEQGWLGRGPSVVVTDLGIYHFDDEGEMRLDFLHPGATLEQVHAAMGWEPRIADHLAGHPGSDRRRAAPHPRGARPPGRLHEVGRAKLSGMAADSSAIIRPATAGDQAAITSLVRQAHLNPRDLDWRRFVVAVDGDRVVGTVQVRIHRRGSRELASLVVEPTHRGSGLGGRLVETVIGDVPGTLYLMTTARRKVSSDDSALERSRLARRRPTSGASSASARSRRRSSRSRPTATADRGHASRGSPGSAQVRLPQADEDASGGHQPAGDRLRASSTMTSPTAMKSSGQKTSRSGSHGT